MPHRADPPFVGVRTARIANRKIGPASTYASYASVYRTLASTFLLLALSRLASRAVTRQANRGTADDVALRLMLRKLASTGTFMETPRIQTTRTTRCWR